jgi:glucose-1-phosphate cytidylyltransferase
MNRIDMPPAMILCGGLGTRLRDVTEALPKPMVPIGSQPIVWHIMKSYAAFGVRRFILCLGYKREAFIDYFMNYRARATDVTIDMRENGRVTYHSSHQEEDWEVTLADTGEKTMTGGRVAQAAVYLRPEDDDFFLSYGDGVANVDVRVLYEHHRRQGKAITVTAVRPAGRFGELRMNGTEVSGFYEKPDTEAGLINGGFMVVTRRFLERYLTRTAGLILEQEPMRQAAQDGAMSAYVHTGFWQCMDTPREHQMLNQLWESGRAPWAECWR